MKVFIVIVGLLFVGLQVDSRAIGGDSDELDGDDEACIAELHLNRAKIAAVDMGKKLPENDEEFINFMGCTGKRQGLISSKGKIVYDELVKEMHDVAEKDPEFTPEMLTFFKELTTAAIDECHQDHISRTNSGLTLIKVMNCVTKKLEEVAQELK